jgi:hypothetical protein
LIKGDRAHIIISADESLRNIFAARVEKQSESNGNFDRSNSENAGFKCSAQTNGSFKVSQTFDERATLLARWCTDDLTNQT